MSYLQVFGLILLIATHTAAGVFGFSVGYGVEPDTSFTNDERPVFEMIRESGTL